MTSCGLTLLIDQRCTAEFSVKKVTEKVLKKIACLDKDDKIPIVLLNVEMELFKQEKSLFKASSKYRELIDLEDCRKKLQDSLFKRDEHNKKRRSEDREEMSQQEEASESTAIDVLSLLGREKFDKNIVEQLQQVVIAQKKQIETLEAGKVVYERIMEKMNQLKQIYLNGGRNAGQYASEVNYPSNENDAYKQRKARILSNLYPKELAGLGGGYIPNSLGKSGQAISRPITVSGSRKPWEEDGLGSEHHALIAKESSSSATSTEQHASSSSTSTSLVIQKNLLKTAFGHIFFSINDACMGIYYITTAGNCSVFSGAYGIVFCLADHDFAYKVIFCQNIFGSKVLVKINDEKVVKSMERSYYTNAVYESRISSRLEKSENQGMKDACVFVESKFIDICVLF